MTFLTLVNEWAKNQGWWSDHQTGFYLEKEDGYLNIGKKDPLDPAYGYASPRRSYLTLWADGAWDLNGEYPVDKDQKLSPADPDFFINLKYLIVTKT